MTGATREGAVWPAAASTCFCYCVRKSCLREQHCWSLCWCTHIHTRKMAAGLQQLRREGGWLNQTQRKQLEQQGERPGRQTDRVGVNNRGVEPW